MSSSVSSPAIPQRQPLAEDTSPSKPLTEDVLAANLQNPGVAHEDKDQCDDTEEDDDYYDGYYDDLDDELMIPRSLSKKLKRDRLRITGKRAFMKRGCVYGKYRLGNGFKN